MSKKQKKELIRIIVCVVLFGGLFAAELLGVFDKITGPWPWFGKALFLVLSVAVYLLAGYDVLWEAITNIFHGQVFDENFLMTIATIGAFVIGEYTEAAGVMIFYQIGEWFQSYAVGKSRASISKLMEIAPEYANLEKDGEIEEVDPEEVHVGDIFVVKPGEKVPLDGIVISGTSMLDTSSLTGESVPRSIHEDEEIYSGSVNLNGLLRIRATKEYEDSTVAKILDLVENASSKKAPQEQFISKFARYYTPAVTICAVLLCVLPPLFISPGDFSVWAEWIRRACTFLVISCPCALVISIPLGFFGGIGAASKIGVLVKGSNYLDALTQVKTIAVDKTGTLTEGVFEVNEIVPLSPSLTNLQLLEIAGAAEKYSNHPIAAAIVSAAFGTERTQNNSISFDSHEELAGRGIKAVTGEEIYFIGNRKLLSEENIRYPEPEAVGTVVYVARGSECIGYLVVGDRVKDEAKEAVSELRNAGIGKIVMLTGDRKEAAENVQREVGADEVISELLPEGKVQAMEDLLTAEEKNGKVAFAGDGMNDAPVLMRADVGICMGAIGSDAAIEAADIVLMDDDLSKIAKTIQIAKRTIRIVRENIILALGVKAVVLVLGALGLASMWLAMFADVGVAVLAILNAMRTLRVKK